MMIVCVSETCPENGIPKTLSFELGPGETVQCGWCNEPCEEYTEPDPDAPIIDNTLPAPEARKSIR
jgi:hypothetical protein